MTGFLLPFRFSMLEFNRVKGLAFNLGLLLNPLFLLTVDIS